MTLVVLKGEKNCLINTPDTFESWQMQLTKIWQVWSIDLKNTLENAELAQHKTVITFSARTHYFFPQADDKSPLLGLLWGWWEVYKNKKTWLQNWHKKRRNGQTKQGRLRQTTKPIMTRMVYQSFDAI